MKTPVFVMLFALSAAITARAADGIDQDLTLVGNDEALLSIPDPWLPLNLDVPPLDVGPLEPERLPPFLPPLGEWDVPVREQFPIKLLEPRIPPFFPR